MKKKLGVLMLSLCLSLSLTVTLFAQAAVKENIVGDNIITPSGIINEVDWMLVGDTADETFVRNVKGDVIELGVEAWAGGWFAPWDKISFEGDNPIVMSFDAISYTAFTFRPMIGTNFQTTADSLWMGTGALIDSGAHLNSSALEYYSDEAMTTAHPGTSGKNCWFEILPPASKAPNGVHVEIIFKKDGTLGLRSTYLESDGSLSQTKSEVWVKNAYALTADEYYVALNFWQNSLLMDNFKLTNGVDTIADVNFSNAGWREVEGIPTQGKIYCPPHVGRTRTIAEITVEDFPNADRLVTEMKIAIDNNVNKAFKLTGAIDFRELTKKFGFAFGLSTSGQAYDAEGTSFVYFENRTEDGQTVTYVNVMNDGEEGTAVSLEANLVEGEFYEYTLEANKDGTAILSIAGKQVNLEIANLAGHMAILTAGEGTVNVGIGAETKLVSYSYRGSTGGAVAINFNTGYVNPANFSISSVNAVMFKNSEEARGIVVEDGKLKFSGTADNSFFGFNEEYSDFILEFKYEEFHEDDKPELKDTWAHGYSPLAVNIGVKEGGGWGKSVMIILKDNNVQMQNYKNTSLVVDTPNDYKVHPETPGTTKITAVKIVVMNNTITVYMQDATQGADAENYVKYAEFTVADAYGRVTFGTTESGVFNLDDIRITPIDDPDPEKMAKNLENYVDLEEIPDEHRPVTLAAPTLTVNGAVVSWNAVENATGYIININGNETEVGADVLSYTFTENGTYTVTVKAKGNGSYIRDSEQSNAVTVTVGQSNDGEEEDNENKGCGGCSGAIGGGLAATSLATIGFALLRKRRTI